MPVYPLDTKTGKDGGSVNLERVVYPSTTRGGMELLSKNYSSLESKALAMRSYLQVCSTNSNTWSKT